MESKSPKLWAIVTISVATIGCISTIVAAVLSAPWITQVLFTPTPMPNIATAVSGTQAALMLTASPPSVQVSPTQLTPLPSMIAGNNLSPTVPPTPDIIASPVSPSSGTNLWHAKFYDNTDFKEPAVFEREDSLISFDWGTANPAPNVPKDNFSIHWSKCVTLEERYYTFSASTSDYLLISVDGSEVIKIYYGGSDNVDYYASAGQHCIDVYYYDGSSNASVYVEYK